MALKQLQLLRLSWKKKIWAVPCTLRKLAYICAMLTEPSNYTAKRVASSDNLDGNQCHHQPGYTSPTPNRGGETLLREPPPFLARTYFNQYDELLNTHDSVPPFDDFHLDNSFFGFDFPLFDNSKLEESLFNTPVSTSSSLDTTTTTTNATALDPDYFDLTTTLIEELLPTSTSIIPAQQAPSPDASGSEEPSPGKFSPSSERSHDLPGTYLIRRETPREFKLMYQEGLTPATTPNVAPLPTPTDSNLRLPLFPPLEGFPSSVFPSALSTPTSSVTTSSSRRKRKASDLQSPRPKELVPTEILSDDDDKDVRRKRNTAAARRYRQKKQDRMKELEEELEEERKEKEMWRNEAQKQKMEAEKWLAMVQFMKESLGK
ncbi:hypothetical protein K440DRAFT_658720 [Wilcoxina mikolae CBS 423.85]|nr:hypothetical protein K440DRAFT_658720 [Wilcoxina mikolae CBS 423.85]